MVRERVKERLVVFPPAAKRRSRAKESESVEREREKEGLTRRASEREREDIAGNRIRKS